MRALRRCTRSSALRKAIDDGLHLVKMRIVFLSVSAISLLTATAIEAQAQGYTCKASDSYSAIIIRQVNASIADTISRRALGLPNVAPSQVTLATDPSLCNRAGLGIDSVALSQHPSKPQPAQGSDAYYVIKIGTYTGATRVDPTGGRHHAAFFIFGPAWELISVADF
jgi:hypothetical protein